MATQRSAAVLRQPKWRAASSRGRNRPSKRSLPFRPNPGFEIYPDRDPARIRRRLRQKKSNGHVEKIDYALYAKGNLGSSPGLETKLQTMTASLLRYFNSTQSVRVSILTNGLRFLHRSCALRT